MATTVRNRKKKKYNAKKIVMISDKFIPPVQRKTCFNKRLQYNIFNQKY